MTERINKIMESEDMTPTKFADAIGVKRATLSHITSGRNNPSLDVVTKILQRFPRIDPDWLLLGKGQMIKGSRVVEPDLFASSWNEYDEASNNAHILEKSVPVHEYRKENESKEHVEPIKLPDNQIIKELERPSKKITKIMLIYSDNSFDTFVPEKNETE